MKSKSYILLFLAEFTFYISSYIVQMMAGRFLGPEDYGRYTLVITATLLVANLIGSGIPIAMSKFLSEAKARHPDTLGEIRIKSMRAQVIVMGVVTAIFFALSPVFAYLLGDMTLTPLFMIATFIIPCYSADSFYFYLFSGLQLFSIQSALKFVRAFLRITVISALTYFFHIEGIFIGYLLVPLGVLAMAMVVDYRTDALKQIHNATASGGFSLKKIYAFAFPITAFLVLFEVFLSFDMYLLKYLFGSDALAGQYGATLTIARIPSFLFYALTLILLPSISESFANMDAKRYKTIVENALRFMLILAFPFIAFASAYPQSIVGLFFGEKFLSAGVFLPVLALGTTLLSILYVLAFAYNGAGKIKTPLLLVGVGIGANFVLDIFLVGQFGSTAVPLGKLLVVLLLLPFLLMSLKKIFGAVVPLTSTTKIIFASGAIFLIARWSGDTTPAMFLTAPMLFLAYGAFLWFTGVVRREDLGELKMKNR